MGGIGEWTPTFFLEEVGRTREKKGLLLESIPRKKKGLLGVHYPKK
jgi:hypothetical protein